MLSFSEYLTEEVLHLDAEHALIPSKKKDFGKVQFDIHHKKTGKVGVVTLKKHGTHHSIKVINLDNKARGKGLGTKTVVALSKKLGKITSSEDGDTSEAAHKMWHRVPNVKKEPRPESKTGFVYATE